MRETCLNKGKRTQGIQKSKVSLVILGGWEMELNTNKAGMEGLDKAAIEETIRKASEGSLFYRHRQRKEAQLASRVAEERRRLSAFSAQEIASAESRASAVLAELEEELDLGRVCVHVDMDAFFAAVEMRDDATLRDVPMAVGSTSMLSTSNYAARRFGVRAAMPGFIANKLCPTLKIVPVNFQKVLETSTLCSPNRRNRSSTGRQAQQ